MVVDTVLDIKVEKRICNWLAIKLKKSIILSANVFINEQIRYSAPIWWYNRTCNLLKSAKISHVNRLSPSCEYIFFDASNICQCYKNVD